MRRNAVICLLVGAAAGFLLGRMGAPESRGPVGPGLPAGAVIEVEAPTGELIHAAGGSGEGQMRYRRHRLRVAKVRGEPAAVPSDPAPWRVTVGGVTYVTVPVE